MKRLLLLAIAVSIAALPALAQTDPATVPAPAVIAPTAQDFAAKAEECLRNKDFSGAIQNYSSAAIRSTDSHKTAEYALQYATIAYDHSEGPDGSYNYRVALAGYRHALHADPASVPAGDKLLAELFALNQEFMDPVADAPFGLNTSLDISSTSTLTVFPLLTATADQILEARPDCPLAHSCRACMSMFKLLMMRAWATAPKATTDQINADLDFAMKNAPNDPTGFIVACQFKFDRAELLPNSRAEERLQQQIAAIKILEDFLEKHPDNPDVAATWANWRILLDGNSPKNRNKEAELFATLKKTDDRNPGNPRLATVLSALALRAGDKTAAESFLKTAADKNPNQHIALWRLARFQESLSHYDDQAASLTTIADSRAGKGRDAFLNQQLALIARAQLPRTYLSTAQSRLTSDPSGKSAKTPLLQASVALDRLRDDSPNDPWITILDARFAYLSHDPLAMDKLKKAEEIATLPRQVSQTYRTWSRNFREAKLNLAEAYAKRGDIQPAIDCYTDIIDMLQSNAMPEDIEARLMRAHLNMSIKRYGETIKDCEALYNEIGENPTLIRLWANAELLAGNPDRQMQLLKMLDKTTPPSPGTSPFPN